MKEQYQEERGNSITHLIGAVFALSSIWMVWPAASLGWQWSMGVIFFIADMFLMFLGSTIFHLLPPPPPSREVCQISCPLTEWPGHPPSHPPNNP